jgi:rod shape-determining protein MreD
MSVVEAEEVVRDREFEARRRRIPWLALAVAVALVGGVYAQIAFAVDARVGGATPEFVVLALLGVARRWGPTWGAVSGFTAGVLLDLATAGPIGGSALVLVLVGWSMGFLGRRGPRASVLTAFGVLAAGVVLRGVLDLMAQTVLGTMLVDPVNHIAATIVGAFLTLVVAIPFLVAWRLIDRDRSDTVTVEIAAGMADETTVELPATAPRGAE